VTEFLILDFCFAILSAAAPESQIKNLKSKNTQLKTGELKDGD
jgi:hypothetical protein